MSTTDGQRPGSAVDASAPLQLVRAAAALRWKRPDLTATLAELALDAADDAVTWVTAAGWLLHGRTALGDGREVACDLLDGLGRWGEAGGELMAGPHGRRLRIELAGPARRSGELVQARTLLAADPGTDDLDDTLRSDVLTELARCAIDDAPDTADATLDAAEEAWLTAGCEPGVASVLLLRATHHRRAGRADAAAAAAAAGLSRVNAGGRRAGGTESDHLAAALTAEWIAALVGAGRMEEARGEAVGAAARLLATSRPSRQRAGLRLAVARVTAAEEGVDAVLAALEPAAQDAAESGVPDLESACRSMLAELHEAAGRLDDALSGVRAAMAAERRDHDRGARLRRRLVTPAATWAGRPSGSDATRRAEWPSSLAPTTHEAEERPGVDRGGSDRLDEVPDLEIGAPGASEHGPPSDPIAVVDSAEPARTHSMNRNGATGPGRRARRLAAESAEAVGWSDAALPELGAASARAAHVGQAGDLFAADTARVPNASAGSRTPEADQRRWGDVASSTARLGSVSDPERHSREPLTDARPAATAAPASTTDTGRSVALGGATGGRSLIGDALLRELVESAPPRSGGSDVASSGGDAEPIAPARRNGHTAPDAPAERRHDTRRDPGHANRDPLQRVPADPASDDTVVFEREARLGAGATTHPAGAGTGGAARQPSPPAGAGRTAPTTPSSGAGELSRPVPEAGSTSPAGGTGRPSAVGRTAPVADDTRGGGSASPGGPYAPHNGHRHPTASNSGGGATEAPEPYDTASSTPTSGNVGPRRAGRPRSPDADGPGLGDLLADALAAYRSI